MLPHLAVFKSVSEFYNNDYRHGVFTKARDDLRDTMHSHDPLIFYDSQVGGALCRRRSFALWESLEAHHTLKPWTPQIQFGPAKSPATWALTGSDVPEDLWVRGILDRKSPQPMLVTDSPTVVGQVTFPLPGSGPQPGVSYKLRRGTYRLDTVYPNGQCRMMNTYRKAPDWARETVVAQSTLASMTPTPMSYPVYSSSCSLLSLRSWGEFPIGNHCLIMGKRRGTWQARRTSVYEQWCWVHTTMSLAMQRRLYDLLLTCADEPYVRKVSGALVTSAQCDATHKVILERRLSLLEFQASPWRDIPLGYVSAPIPGPHGKRTILLLVSLEPSPAVLVSTAVAVPSASIQDATRAHEP